MLSGITGDKINKSYFLCFRFVLVLAWVDVRARMKLIIIIEIN